MIGFIETSVAKKFFDPNVAPRDFRELVIMRIKIMLFRNGLQFCRVIAICNFDQGGLYYAMKTWKILTERRHQGRVSSNEALLWREFFQPRRCLKFAVYNLNFIVPSFMLPT